MKLKYGTLCVTLLTLLLGSCFNMTGNNNRGSIQIGIDSRYAVNMAEATTQLSYDISFTGPGNTRTVHIPAGSPLSCTVEVIPGTWTVTIKASGPRPAAYNSAYFPAEMLRAYGTTAVVVKTGQSSPAEVLLHTATEAADGNQLADAITNISASEELIFVTDNIAITGTITIGGGKMITLLSEGTNRVITKGANNINLFKIEDPGSALTLGNPEYSAYKLELDGNSTFYSGESLVQVENSGILIIGANAVLRNNKKGSDGGGVYCDSGTVEIRGGEISGNTIDSANYLRGGGIYATNGSTVKLYAGTIRDNTVSVLATGNLSTLGGGAFFEDSNFEMFGGSIESNTAYGESSSGAANGGGGGVNLNVGSTFIMHNGTIRGNMVTSKPGNTWLSAGGGGLICSGVFIMNGGVINGNICWAVPPNNTSGTYYNGAYAGGVALGGAPASMEKHGGFIYGNNAVGSDADGFALKNVALHNGTTIATASEATFPATPSNAGHAVLHIGDSATTPIRWRDGTSGPDDDLDSAIPGSSGGWD